MNELYNEIINGSWPFKERSTRNCIHCKTTMAKGNPKAYCSRGRHLAKRKAKGDKLYAISLQRVLSRATWVSPVCGDCPLFEHDEEAK